MWCCGLFALFCSLGLYDTRIALKHVLPNAMVAAMTFLPFILAGSLVTLTSLDFLGLGMPPGYPSLGELLQQGKALPVDIRDAASFGRYRIPSAIHVPAGELAGQPGGVELGAGGVGRRPAVADQ